MALAHSPQIVTNGLVFAYDMANVKSFPRNVHPFPTDLYSWVTGGYQQTITRDSSIQSPVGDKPLKIVTSGTSSYSSSYNSAVWNLGKSKVGDTWTASFWVKGSGNFEGRCIIFESNDAGSYIGAVGKTYSITTEWTRVSVSHTFTNASTTNMQFRFDIYVSGVTVWYDGLQLERNTVATNFSAITNTQGTKLFDLTGNNTITANSLTYNSDGTFSFGSSGTDYISIPSTVLNGLTNWTIDFWMQRDISNSASIDTFLTCGSGNDFLWYFRNPDNTVTLENTAGSSLAYSVTNGVPFNFTATGSGGSVSVYKNGSLIGTMANTTTITVGSTIGILLGQEMDTQTGSFDPNQAWKGKIYGSKFYNRVLSAAEVKQNFNAIRGRYGI